MNENEDIDESYDYFGSYMKEREQQSKNLQNFLEKSAKIDFNEEIPDEQVDFCGTFIDQIVELRTMRENKSENNNFLDHTHEIQQQLMATLDEEIAITKNTIEQELQEQQHIIEEQFQQNLLEYQTQNEQNTIDLVQQDDDFLQQLQNDIQREEKYHELAIKLQNTLQQLLNIHDQQISDRQKLTLKNQQASQLIRSEYEKGHDPRKNNNIVLNTDVFKYNKEQLVKRKQYKVGHHHKLIVNYYQQLEQELQQRPKSMRRTIKKCLIDLVLQKPTSTNYTDIIPQLISQNITQYVVVVNLSSQNLDSSIFNKINMCTFLCDLDLSNNQIECLSAEHSFNNLQILKLNNNKISKINSNILQNMSILQQLNLQANQLEDDQILTVLKLKYIRDLDISDNNISNEFFNRSSFSISLLTINMNTFMLSPEKIQMYMPNLIYLSIRGPLSKEVYENMQFLMPKMQIIHFSDVTDPRPQLDEVLYAKQKLPKLKRISDVEVKSLQFQSPLESTLYKQEEVEIDIEKLFLTKKYINQVEKTIKTSLPSKFFSAAPQGNWEFKEQFQSLLKFFQLPDDIFDLKNINFNEKSQFTNVKRCVILLLRAKQLLSDQIVTVQSNQEMMIKMLLLPKILTIQRFFRKTQQQTKLYTLFKTVDVTKDLHLVKQLLQRKSEQQQIQQQIQQHIVNKQIADNKQKRLLELQELLTQVENEISNQESLSRDLETIQNLLKFKIQQKLFSQQYIKKIQAKQIIINAMKKYNFRKKLNQKLQEARSKINNKKQLISDLSNQYNFDDFDDNAIMAMTTKALNDLDFAFDDGLKEQLSNIVQEEESKVNEKSKIEAENQPPKRPHRQVKPKQSLEKEKLKRPSSSTSDLRTSQLILDSDSHIPGVLPPIQPTYDSSALITDSGLIDSELNDMSCIESMLVNSSAINTNKKSPVRNKQPKVIIEPKQISPEKAMRTAQKDGWNFQDNNTAVAYYKMVQRQKRLARASKK